MSIPAAPVHSFHPAWKTAWSGGVGALALCAVVLSPTAWELVESWQKSEAYHYAWLVLPMFPYLVAWHYRDELRAESPQPDAAGVAVAALAALGWSAASAANIAIGRQLALILVIHGVAWSALGRRLYRRLFAVMSLLFFLLPSADLLLKPLRYVTLKAIEWFALVCQLPFRNDGFSVHIGANSYVIVDACAGLSHVTLTAFLGYCFALLIYRSLHKIVALTLFTALLGIVSNVLRVNAIVWIDWTRAYQMDLAAHSRIQWVALSLVLAVLFYALLKLDADAVPTGSLDSSASPNALPPSPRGWQIPLAAGLAVLVIAGGAALLLKDAPRLPGSGALLAAPETILDWELAAPATNWSAKSGFRALTLNYRRQGQDVRIIIVEALAPALTPHLTHLAVRDQTAFRETWSEPVSSCGGAQCASFIDVVFRREQVPTVRHVYYRYAVGVYHTSSVLRWRAAIALSRLLGKRESARLIGFSVDGDGLPVAELAGVELALESALLLGAASGAR